MGKYLIDNNVISNFFSGQYPKPALNFVSKVFDEVPTISVITEIEALSWITKDKNKESIVTDFVSDSVILGIDRNVVNRCVELRRTKKIKTPDAIIAATAMVHNLILITSDKDFHNIDNLKIVDPFSIEN